ncbi:MAG TPA: hypothetical protein VMT11_00910 [Myxococcaceae bacterium]|nr:hypothetical protein [Myxococcaceae bacterium]
MFVGPSYADVARILVPPGWYLITAKVILANTTVALPSLTRCVLTRDGSLLDLSEGTLLDTSGKATLTLHAAAQLTGTPGEHVALSCQADYPGTANATDGQLTAIQVSTITAPGP